jgi:hypothetical protein
MKFAGGLASRYAIACTLALAVMSAFLIAHRVMAPLGTSEPVSEPIRPTSTRAWNALTTGAGTVHRASTSGDPLWQKRWWIEKTARLLRGGEGLGPDDDIDALLKLSEEEIARRFMSDPRFGDAILDFNLYFLGFKVDDLKSEGIYKRHAFDFANAVASAQALLTDGDYFKLFDFEGDFFMAPLRSTPHEDPPLPDDVGLSPEQMRKKAVGEMQAVFAELIAFATTPKPPSRQELCRRLKDVVARTDHLTSHIYRAFDDPEIFVIVRGQAISSPFAVLAEAADEDCAGKSRSPQADVRELADAIKTASDQFTRAFTEILSFEPETYEPQSVLEFRRFDLSALPKMDKWLAFGFEQAMALQNSSTNFNRKRAAYVLKRFFCDDLTPVGFEDPQEHVGGAHGSSTSCYACHYKLEPMAGFFRGRGRQFYDYSRQPEVVFDDSAEMNLRRYEATWRGRRGSSRKWNVGYVRSPRWESQNSYGETLTDLSRIIRSAPEAKRCLMKRLFEHMTAENQTIDGGYLDHLTRAFEAEAVKNSSQAVQNAIVRVLQSQTYRQQNPDPDKCYDHGPDANASRDPPCRVAFILQKNCAQCHGAANDADAGLDLGAWVLAPDGKSLTFPHLDDTMQQMPAQDTMTKIMERLSSTNLKTRMPKNKIMSSQERQELYLWAQQELGRILKGSRP